MLNKIELNNLMLEYISTLENEMHIEEWDTRHDIAYQYLINGFYDWLIINNKI